MARAIKGVFIECEPDIREVLLMLDAKEKFIIEDLDSRHLFINAAHLSYIQSQLDKELESTVYEVEAMQQPKPV